MTSRQRKNPLFQNRIVLWILLPVFVMGGILAVLSVAFLTPELLSLLKSRTEANLRLATDMGLAVCEERFSDLLDLRLENDPEMNSASRREAIEQIETISRKLPKIEMLVVEGGARVAGSSLGFHPEGLRLSGLRRGRSGIVEAELLGKPVRMHHRYFPFWRWHIVSVISKSDYMAPISLARNTVYFGTFGVLAAALGTLLLVFHWRVNRPLRRLMEATEGVSRGDFTPVKTTCEDEIGRVAAAFNVMVQSLQSERERIKAMMIELRDSEERYRVVTEYSPTSIVMLQKGRFIYANETATEKLRCSSCELLGRFLEEVLHPDDRERVSRKIEALEGGEKAMDRFECRCKGYGGGEYWLESLAVLILYKEKPAVLMNALDITERKRAEAERAELEKKLQAAQKMEAVGALAGGVAHDLNNILGGIVGYPDLLLLQIPEDSPLRKPLLAIRHSGQRAAAIVQDMLTLARRGVAVEEVVNLNQIIRDYLESPEHERLCRASPLVKFEPDLQADLPNVLGSPVHLEKTVMNLVSNAAQAMRHGGTVGISTTSRSVEEPIHGYETIEPGDYVVLSVTDQGEGICPEDLVHIFEPFYTKKVMGASGTGLGMSVVWGTVQDHKGFIDVSSLPGRQTRFDLYFPLTRMEAPADESEVHLNQLSGSERILVVDDVDEQREIAERMLQQLGYDVVTAAGGEEAVEYLKRNRVDLVLLDMIMAPGMDGLETYRAISGFRPHQKAIIVSGFSETERVREARSLGAGGYVKKPYVLERIGKAVREELERPPREAAT